MLDFATLRQAKQGLQSSTDERHQQSTVHYKQGRQLIREAIQSPINKDKLKQAADCFCKGIQFNRKNPANYLGMGFLFLLLSQPRQAIPYINAALEIEPESELGQELFRQSQATHLPKSHSQAALVQVPQLNKSQSGIDFDDLHDSTEAAIILFLKQILNDETLTYQPAPDPQQLQILQSRLHTFQAKSQEFHQALQVLDAEIEVSDLRQQIQIIERALRRIKTLAHVFEQFIEIDQDIKRHEILSCEMIAKAEIAQNAAEIQVLEANLQVLLDHCDHVADRLDALDAKQINIQPLKGPYKQYVGQLEHFQDLLEETMERLSFEERNPA